MHLSLRYRWLLNSRVHAGCTHDSLGALTSLGCRRFDGRTWRLTSGWPCQHQALLPAGLWPDESAGGSHGEQGRRRCRRLLPNLLHRCCCQPRQLGRRPRVVGAAAAAVQCPSQRGTAGRLRRPGPCCSVAARRPGRRRGRHESMAAAWPPAWGGKEMVRRAGVSAAAHSSSTTTATTAASLQ